MCSAIQLSNIFWGFLAIILVLRDYKKFWCMVYDRDMKEICQIFFFHFNFMCWFSKLERGEWSLNHSHMLLNPLKVSIDKYIGMYCWICQLLDLPDKCAMVLMLPSYQTPTHSGLSYLITSGAFTNRHCAVYRHSGRLGLGESPKWVKLNFWRNISILTYLRFYNM